MSFDLSFTATVTDVKSTPNMYNKEETIYNMTLELAPVNAPSGNSSQTQHVSKFMYANYTEPNYKSEGKKLTKGSVILYMGKIKGKYKDGKMPTYYNLESKNIIVLDRFNPASAINRAFGKVKFLMAGPSPIEGVSKVLMSVAKQATGKDNKLDYSLKESWFYIPGLLNMAPYPKEKVPLNKEYVIDGTLVKGLMPTSQDMEKAAKTAANQPMIAINYIYF